MSDEKTAPENDDEAIRWLRYGRSEGMASALVGLFRVYRATGSPMLEAYERALPSHAESDPLKHKPIRTPEEMSLSAFPDGTRCEAVPLDVKRTCFATGVEAERLRAATEKRR